MKPKCSASAPTINGQPHTGKKYLRVKVRRYEAVDEIKIPLKAESEKQQPPLAVMDNSLLSGRKLYFFK